MGKLVEVTGDLFEQDAKLIGHGVNCKGSMGAGIAADFQKRFPYNFQAYKEACTNYILDPGGCYIYCESTYNKDYDLLWIANIASQDEPGREAKYLHVLSGVSLAMHHAELVHLDLYLPRIGCGIGGLDWVEVKDILEKIAWFSSQDIVVVTPQPKW